MLKTCNIFSACILKYSHTAALILVICAVGLAPSARAVDVATLFTAEVLLDESSDNPRADAYKAALVEVLTRVSGQELAGNEQALNELFPVPSAYVTQFRPGIEGTLWVSFDGEAIDRVLRSAGQRVWGAERPLTVVWLAVDWGQGQREIVAAGDPDRTVQQTRSIDRNHLLRERVLEAARKRGLPLVFPLLDTTDLQGVTFSDIWGGFDERVVAASKRYDASSILIGRVRTSSSGQNRWTYVFGDQSKTWHGPAEVVIGQIADTLAAEFSAGGTAPLDTVEITVSGIQSVRAFGSVQKLLADIRLIEGFQISGVSGDTVRYQIEVRSNPDRLRRALRFAGLLESERATGADGPGALAADALEFFYSP